MKKRKYQQIGGKQVSLSLGSKQTNDFLDKVERNTEAFYIEKLREAYAETTIVNYIKFSDEDRILLNLLNGDVNGMRLKQEVVSENNVVYVFETKEMEFIIVLNRFSTSFNVKFAIMADTKNAYEAVDAHLKQSKKIPLLKLSKTKEQLIGSFGYSSHLAEMISEHYNIQHIAFNPVFFKSNATVYKIRGDPLSLFAYGTNTYEIVKSFSGLDNNASSIKNF